MVWGSEEKKRTSCVLLHRGEWAHFSCLLPFLTAVYPSWILPDYIAAVTIQDPATRSETGKITTHPVGQQLCFPVKLHPSMFTHHKAAFSTRRCKNNVYLTFCFKRWIKLCKWRLILSLDRCNHFCGWVSEDASPLSLENINMIKEIFSRISILLRWADASVIEKHSLKRLLIRKWLANVSPNSLHTHTISGGSCTHCALSGTLICSMLGLVLHKNNFCYIEKWTDKSTYLYLYTY